MKEDLILGEQFCSWKRATTNTNKYCEKYENFSQFFINVQNPISKQIYSDNTKKKLHVYIKKETSNIS